MRSPTPAVRAALFGLVVVTLVAVAGAGLHLAAVERDAEAATGRALLARSAVVAAAIEPGDLANLSSALERFGSSEADGDLVLLDARGRIYDATNDELIGTVDWPGVVAGEAGTAQTVSGRTADVIVALSTAWDGGPFVAAVQPYDGTSAEGDAIETLLATLLLGSLLVAMLVVIGWYAGPRASQDLSLLGERVATGAGDRAALVRSGRRALGPLAEAFLPLAAKLGSQERDMHGAREHVAALYQINPHYVVLCALDGRIVEANPAFYAITGLSSDVVRGGSVDALREVFPIEPLLETARRSLLEGSSISGIEYGIIAHDNETRSVEVSLRAFTHGGEDLVVVQATDLARQKTLERRVAAFSDTLDLMVDQRVQQLTAGQQTLRAVLNAAGVVIASFDTGGATSRWNGGARALTGQPIVEVPHFAAVTAALGLDPAERAAFTQWFWSPSDAPFVARHEIGMGADMRVRQLIWQRVYADISGRADLRTLVGVEVPADLEIDPARTVPEMAEAA